MDPTRRRIRKIDRDAQRFVAQALGNADLSLSDYDMIHTVRHRPGITQEELRVLYCQDKSTVARRAARLEADGYLERRPHPEDRRRKQLFVTARGEALRDAKIDAESFYFSWLTELLTAEETDVLCRLLDRLQLRSQGERRQQFQHLLARYAQTHAGSSPASDLRTPTLETDRLVLRRVRREDAPGILNGWMGDEAVARYMLWTASGQLRDAEEFVRFELENLENPQWNRWLLVEKGSGFLVGTCLLFWNETEASWDVSYNLGQAFWGRGYATEAMARILDYGAAELGIRTCIAAHAAENPASGRVLEKLGFRYETDVPYRCGSGQQTTGKFYRRTVE